MYKVQSESRKEYNNSKSYSLDAFSDKKIEKIIKDHMLETLKYNAKYYYSTAIKFSDSENLYIKHMKEEICRNEWSIIDIISKFDLPYPKIDKKSYARLMKIMSKCVKDYQEFAKKIDIKALFDKKGIL